MNKILIAILPILIIASCKDHQDSKVNKHSPVVEIGASKIPYFIIETEVGIENEPKVPGKLTVYEEKQLTQALNIGIEYRGSTSFRISDKKSYGIEIWDETGDDKEESLLGLPKDEDWILGGQIVNLTDQFSFDKTLLYNYLGYELYREMGNYASRTAFVELQVNGTYLGLYLLMEKLKRGKNRIAIESLDGSDLDISGGYILKIDKTSGGDLGIVQPLEYYLSNWADDASYNSDISFRSNYDIFGNILELEPFQGPYHTNMYLETYFLYEYPKPQQITPSQKEYIQSYIRSFETALLTDDFKTESRTYTDYIAIESFADFFILNELVRNVDGYRISTYLTKNRGEKLKMGPVWDLDIGFDSGDRIPWDGWVIDYNQYVSQDAWMVPFWWSKLIADPIFRQVVKERWIGYRANVLSNNSILGKVDKVSQYLVDNGATDRNFKKWDIGTNYPESINNLKSYLAFRLNWMDNQINDF